MRVDYREFPPFTGENRLDIKHLGAEYNAISVALVNGRGFADPFRTHTGPTAWMPPMFSWILAALRWDGDGNITYVQTGVVILQDLALIATGWLIIALARRTAAAFGWRRRVYRRIVLLLSAELPVHPRLLDRVGRIGRADRRAGFRPAVSSAPGRWRRRGASLAD